jgi:hypothetical protein
MLGAPIGLNQLSCGFLETKLGGRFCNPGNMRTNEGTAALQPAKYLVRVLYQGNNLFTFLKEHDEESEQHQPKQPV